MYLFLLKINFVIIVTISRFYFFLNIYRYHNECITIVLYLLTENFNRGHDNAPNQNNFPKLPQLHVVLQKIDEVSKEKTMKISRKSSRRKLRT